MYTIAFYLLIDVSVLQYIKIHVAMSNMSKYLSL
jgi:hypothetical protein